ncbi:ATP-binding protein [Parasutterella muris]|uniref:ATP-binding protein n=1 Tax=Parasutterella muris TaxID=2565572 RepID=UPI0020426C4E|nr:ATP-binding protein [Parasutterella muris]
MAIGFGKKAIEMGCAVRFVSASNLLSTLKKARQEGTLAAKINQLQKFKLLIIDELGYLPFSAEDARLCSS